MLTTGQRRTLRRLTMSDSVAPHLARRAKWALEAADGSSDRTARKWLLRYQDAGISGLEEARRSGRPSRVSDETFRRVLTEPLFSAAAKWTSRTVAEAVGLSQATVVRLWSRAFAPETLADAGPWSSLDRNCRPTGLLLDPGGAAMVLERLTTGRPPRRLDRGPEAGAMRSPLRPPLQTVLAGALIDVNGAEPISTAEFLRDAMPNPTASYVVLGDAATDHVVQAIRKPSAVIDVVCVPAGQWQALLPHLVVAMAPSARPVLEGLAHRVREWAAARPTEGFRWTTVTTPKTPERPPEPTLALAGPLVLAPSQRLAEYVANSVLEGLRAGRLRGGDRLTESYLMRTTHASRSQVRDALRTLAMDGLIDLRPGRGAIVPAPTWDDVLETYAMRRAVGGIAMAGAASNWRPGQLGSLLQGMATLQQIAASGDVRATDDGDLDFQDVLAATSNLHRVLMTFRRLTIQIKLFTTVMGLRYAYSIDDILADDSALLDAVRRRDPTEARRLWDLKMEAAVRYMVRQLEHSD